MAQNEAAIWYFGENAGLDFNTGAPVALTDGAIITQEGCATISEFAVLYKWSNRLGPHPQPHAQWHGTFRGFLQFAVGHCGT